MWLTGIVLIALLIIVLSYGRRNSGIHRDCRGVHTADFDKVKIGERSYRYFLCNKTYYFTDSKNQDHYLSEAIVPCLTSYEFSVKKAIAGILLARYGADKITLFESCNYRNLCHTRQKLPEAVSRAVRQKIISFTVNDFAQ